MRPGQQGSQETQASQKIEIGTVPACSSPVVHADVSLARGFRGASSQKFSTGSHEVVFDHNVSRCTHVGIIADSGNNALPSPEEIAVAGRFNNPNSPNFSASSERISSGRRLPRPRLSSRNEIFPSRCRAHCSSCAKYCNIKELSVIASFACTIT
jgi:hypothetical protein